MSTKLTMALLFLCAMVWSGCEHYAPVAEGGDGLARSDVLDMRVLARDVWKLDQPLKYDLPRQPRVAIVEFTLEYVLVTITWRDTDHASYSLLHAIETAVRNRNDWHRAWGRFSTCLVLDRCIQQHERLETGLCHGRAHAGGDAEVVVSGDLSRDAFDGSDAGATRH